MNDKPVETDVDVAGVFAERGGVRSMEERLPEVLAEPAIIELSDFLRDATGASAEKVESYIKGLYMGGDQRVSLDTLSPGAPDVSESEPGALEIA